MRITYLFIFTAILGFFQSAAQKATPNFWVEIPEADIALPEGATRAFEPDAYFSYEMDVAAIRTYLSEAPMEFTRDGATKPLHLALPMGDGTFETFAINESKLVGDREYKKFPLVRSYTGYSLKNAETRVKITLSPYWGFRGTIRRADKGMAFIEKLADGQDKLYMVYDRLAFPAQYFRPELQTQPDFIENPVGMADEHDLPTATMPEADERSIDVNPVTLKVYRFACATTGEFAIDHGGTIDAVLPAMVNYVAQLNAIYEPELAIRLILIDSVESILFLDPATDPYTGTLVPGWREQNPEAMIETIGFNKYDIGHVFARYIEGPILGQASLSSCCTQFKGLACSGGNLPYGVPFLNTIGHEIGHQWSARHTWNHCQALPSPIADAPGSACEPGSGSTIMSYGGACGPVDDVVTGAINLYYNACSLTEIRRFVQQEAGSTCGENVVSDNFPPQITILSPNNLTIPMRTPFELHSSAVDPDGDEMSYCWEQADTGPSVPLGQASFNSPLFRSFPPSTVPFRTFPRIQTIATNQGNPAELLPTYTREMKFSITVRDNQMGGGGVSLDTLKVKVTANAGPFRVSYPNVTNIEWHPGEYQYVTWDVAGTDANGVNCKKVNIRLSKDAGITYPITLATDVPNIGSACVLVPNETGANMRIRVDAADNIFFDISNVNFAITPATVGGFGICTASPVAQACIPGSYSLSVGNSAWAGFNESVSYSVIGLPATATGTFSANPAPAGQDVTLNIDFGTTPEGAYDLKIIATSATITDTADVKVTVVSNVFDAMTLSAPADGSVGVSQAPTLEWSALADANLYQVQVATNPSFAAGTIQLDNAAVAGNTVVANAGLEKGGIYYWRVRPLNECGSGPWTPAFVFSTQVDACATYNAEDLPKNISANSTTPVESVININAGLVSDVNVKSIKLSHDAFNQIEVKLINPSGTEVSLFKNKCGFSATIMNAGFDDAATITTFPCPPNSGQIIRPQQLLSAMNGQSGNGNWKLSVKDNEIGSGGSFTEFSLEVCSAASLNPPVVITNNPLALPSGTNAVIPNGLLKAEDPDNTASQLVFTLVDQPAFGFLELAGVGVLSTGNQFTQAQIDAGNLRYFDYGFATTNDKFRFAVTDGNGGLAAGVFTIGAVVSAGEISSAVRFSLAPNPAKESVRIDFGTVLPADANIFIRDMAGKLVQTLAVKAGTVAQVVNTGNWVSGMYTVTVQLPEGIATRKLMVSGK